MSYNYSVLWRRKTYISQKNWSLVLHFIRIHIVRDGKKPNPQQFSCKHFSVFQSIRDSEFFTVISIFLGLPDILTCVNPHHASVLTTGNTLKFPGYIVSGCDYKTRTGISLSELESLCRLCQVWWDEPWASMINVQAVSTQALMQ